MVTKYNDGSFTHLFYLDAIKQSERDNIQRISIECTLSQSDSVKI